MAAPVILLTGYPGSGKYTVANALAAELAARGVITKVVDNHLVNNPVFSVLRDFPGSFPDEIWEIVGQVRSAVLSALDRFSDPAHALVFTNYVLTHEAADVVPYFRTLDALARVRGGSLRIVCLTCDRDELLRRVVTPARRDRHKATSAEWLANQVDQHEALVPADALVLDVTTLPPVDAAREILSRIG